MTDSERKTQEESYYAVTSISSLQGEVQKSLSGVDVPLLPLTIGGDYFHDFRQHLEQMKSSMSFMLTKALTQTTMQSSTTLDCSFDFQTVLNNLPTNFTESSYETHYKGLVQEWGTHIIVQGSWELELFLTCCLTRMKRACHSSTRICSYDHARPIDLFVLHFSTNNDLPCHLPPVQSDVRRERLALSE